MPVANQSAKNVIASGRPSPWAAIYQGVPTSATTNVPAMKAKFVRSSRRGWSRLLSRPTASRDAVVTLAPRSAELSHEPRRRTASGDSSSEMRERTCDGVADRTEIAPRAFVLQALDAHAVDRWPVRLSLSRISVSISYRVAVSHNRRNRSERIKRKPD